MAPPLIKYDGTAIQMVASVPTFMVVATHNRHEMLADLVESVQGQGVEEICIIDNASVPPVQPDPDLYTLTYDEEQPPNLSRIWNLGLEYFSERCAIFGIPKWNIVITNDDVVLPQGWVQGLGSILRERCVALVSGSNFYRSREVLHTEQKSISCFDRVAGYAHVSRGELGIRFDESMRYWYSDDDFCWQSRVLGGSLVVPGFAVEHRDENGWLAQSVTLGDQVMRDRARFIEKWGTLPC